MTPEKVWHVREALVPTKKKIAALKKMGRDTSHVEIVYLSLEAILDSVSTILGDDCNSQKKVQQHLDLIHKLSCNMERGLKKTWCENLYRFFLELQRKSKPPTVDDPPLRFEFMKFDYIVELLQRLSCSNELERFLEKKGEDRQHVLIVGLQSSW
jgi:hypothetical protein